ncbi:hypothetical protein Tco_0036779 [Tanacetum coccineum]
MPRRYDHGQQRKRSRCVKLGVRRWRTTMQETREPGFGRLFLIIYDTVVVKWKEHQQLLLDEEALRETLEEEEAKAEKGRAKAEKEWEEFVKQEQAHDELFRLEFGVKSDSKYQTD